MAARQPPPPRMVNGDATLPDRSGSRYLCSDSPALLIHSSCSPPYPRRYLSDFCASRVNVVDARHDLGYTVAVTFQRVAFGSHGQVLRTMAPISPLQEVSDMPAFSPRDVVGLNRNGGVIAR
jgi:hypothetical protein